jgi:hypothetical protein
VFPRQGSCFGNIPNLLAAEVASDRTVVQVKCYMITAGRGKDPTWEIAKRTDSKEGNVLLKIYIRNHENIPHAQQPLGHFIPTADAAAYY